MSRPDEESGTAPIDPGPSWEAAEPVGSRPTLLRASWRGARTGFRWTSYIVGPFVAIAVLAGLALVELGIGSGRGFGIPDFLAGAVGAYLVAALWGAAAGLMVGALAYIFREVADWIRAKIRRASRQSVSQEPLQGIPVPRPRGSTEPRPRRASRWPFLLGVPAQLVIVAAFVSGVLQGRYIDQRLATAIAEADQDDPNWRLDDLMRHRELIPEWEDSAPVVARAVALLPRDWPPGPKRPADPGVKPPVDVAQLLDGLTEIGDNMRLDLATADTLRAELEAHREAVRIARTVRFFDRGHHELKIKPAIIDTLLTETVDARRLAKLLAADAAIRAEDGDADGALDSCCAIVSTARSIGDEPFLISQLVRMAIDRIATATARRVLGQGESSDAALARLQALLDNERKEPLLLMGIKGERAIADELIRRIAAGEIPLSALNEGPRSPSFPEGLFANVSPWNRLMYEHQRAVALEWMTVDVATARRPTHEQPPIWEGRRRTIDQVERSREGRFSALLAYSLIPRLSPAAAGFANWQADLGATAILLAAERFRRITRAWPLSIASIGRDLLPDAPLDPYTGKPMLLERIGGQLVIHSVGPNLTDEHGAYVARSMAPNVPDDVGATGWHPRLRRQPPPPPDEDFPRAGTDPAEIPSYENPMPPARDREPDPR